MPLLHVAPPWEPLHTPTRNVSVVPSSREPYQQHCEATARRPADLRLPSPSSPPPSQRLYYSGSLSEESTAHWQTRAIVEELSPMDALLLRDASALYPSDSPQPPPSRGGSGASSSALPANRTSLRLWLTSADVLARAHYDKSHNILCVIRGTKRLVLWPPEELPSLHLYPAVHAAHRQSQVSLTRLGPVRTALESANAPGPGAGAGGMEADGNAPLPLGRTAPSLSGVAGEFSLVDPHALLGMRGRGAPRLRAASASILRRIGRMLSTPLTIHCARSLLHVMGASTLGAFWLVDGPARPLRQRWCVLKGARRCPPHHSLCPRLRTHTAWPRQRPLPLPRMECLLPHVLFSPTCLPPGLRLSTALCIRQLLPQQAHPPWRSLTAWRRLPTSRRARARRVTAPAYTRICLIGRGAAHQPRPCGSRRAPHIFDWCRGRACRRLCRRGVRIGMRRRWRLAFGPDCLRLRRRPTLPTTSCNV